MKKFNDILKENNEGEFDNKIAVELIVKEYDFIRNRLFPYLQKTMNTIEPDLVTERFSDISQLSTIIKENGDNHLKYLGIYFEISLDDLFNKGIDLGRYFTTLREKVSEGFILKDDSVKKGRSTNHFYIQIDYYKFKQSPLYKSIKSIEKFNL